MVKIQLKFSYLVHFQKAPMILFEESDIEYDRIGLHIKSKHNSAKKLIEHCLFEAKIASKFTSFSGFKGRRNKLHYKD